MDVYWCLLMFVTLATKSIGFKKKQNVLPTFDKYRSDRCKSMGPVTSSFTTTYRLRWEDKNSSCSADLVKSWSSLVSIRYNVPSLIISAASAWTVVVQFVEKYASWITERMQAESLNRQNESWVDGKFQNHSLVVWNSPNQSPMKKYVYIISGIEV